VINSSSGNKYVITDWEVSAGSSLRHHHVALCLLLALGASREIIIELLPGLTPGQYAMLERNRIVTQKQEEFRERFLGENAEEQFSRHMPKAFEIMTEVLNADSADMKLDKRFEAAKWLMEKVTGKARQSIDVEGGVNVLTLLTALDEMKAEAASGARGEAKEISARDVTPVRDALADWVSENVPEARSEKGNG
jgi:hypothetical protein